MDSQNRILEQIDAALDHFNKLRGRTKYDDFSDAPRLQVTATNTIMSDAIRRLSPAGSQYMESLNLILRKWGIARGNAVPEIAGVLGALRFAYENDYLQQVSGLIRAEVYTDFVEMAEYLLSEGYKDPAAVVIGSVLEEHLRQLCTKHGITVSSNGYPKKANQLNAELYGQSIYTSLDQKTITGWLDLRNKAAHGKYSEYTKDQVVLLIQGVQEFMARMPA